MVNQVIDESQFAFVHNRKILDRVLVVNEAISWLRKKKKDGVLIKLDFESAYDLVRWEFIDQIL